MKQAKLKAAPSGIDIKVRDLTPKHSISIRRARDLGDLAKNVLKAQKVPHARVSVLLVSAPFIRRLNKKYLSKDRPTDVLSFDLKPCGVRTTCLFGDVVVSVDAAVRASKTFKIPLNEELCRYVIHGILHLTGYDDTTEIKRKKMWKRQEELLNDLFNARFRP